MAQTPIVSAGEALEAALHDLIVAAEQRAAANGAADLIEATPQCDAARAALQRWYRTEDARERLP